jgi:outer membrane protein OmpA-like peptidoglycan-associated protein
MMALLTLPAAGQIVIGGASSPNVIIDYSVLDELGRSPTVPQVLMERPAGRPAYPYAYSQGPRFPLLSGSGRWENPGPIILKPPGTAATRPARKPKQTAKTRKSSPKPAAVAKRAAPPPARKPTRAVRAPESEAKPAPPVTAAENGKPESLMPPPPPRLSSAPSEIVPPPPPPAPPVSTARLPEPPPPKPPARSAPADVPPPPGQRPTPAPQAAAAPKAAALLPGALRRIGFTPGSAKLNVGAAEELRTVADALARDDALRIQLLAYAGQSDDSASQTRRLSLSRALAARSQLIEQGVRSTRIDVRALGNKSAGGPADRIDIIVTKR